MPPAATRPPTFAAVATLIAKIVAERALPWSSSQELHALQHPTRNPAPPAYAELLLDGGWVCLLDPVADRQRDVIPSEDVWREARRMVAEERPPADELAEVRAVAAANPEVLAEVDRVMKSAINDHAKLHAVWCWARNVLMTRPRMLADYPGWIGAVLRRWPSVRAEAADRSLVGDHATRENADLAEYMIQVAEDLGARPPGVDNPGATLSHFALIDLSNRLRNYAVDLINATGDAGDIKKQTQPASNRVPKAGTRKLGRPADPHYAEKKKLLGDLYAAKAVPGFTWKDFSTARDLSVDEAKRLTKNAAQAERRRSKVEP